MLADLTIPSSQTQGIDQPGPVVLTSTGLIDAGHWTNTASWNVPTDAISGTYFGKVVREVTGGASHIVFNAEYPMARFLEANGCDVSYFTGVDAAR